MHGRRDTMDSEGGASSTPSGNEEMKSLIGDNDRTTSARMVTTPVGLSVNGDGSTTSTVGIGMGDMHTSVASSHIGRGDSGGGKYTLSKKSRNVGTGVVLFLLCLSIIIGVVIGKHMPPRVLPVQDPPADYVLKQVQIITRHGARTPLVTLAQGWETEWTCRNHPISVASAAVEAGSNMSTQVYQVKPVPGRQALPGNCKLGQLTQTGVNQHYTLGSKIRDRYVDILSFLPWHYDPSQVYIRSTDIARTRQSAEAFTLGLYPPETRVRSPEPVTQWIVELPAEYMFPNPDRCPALSSLIHKLEASPAYQAPIKQLKPQLDRVFQGKRYPRRIEDLASILKCRQEEQKPLPQGFTPDLANAVVSAADNAMKVVVDDEDYLKMGMGEFVSEIYRNMLDRVNTTHGSSGGKQFYLYSGHDTTIAPFLALFSVYDDKWPQFAANIAIELYKNVKMNRWYFRMLYNGAVQSLSGPCDLDTGLCEISLMASVVNRYRLDPNLCYQ